MTMMKRLRLFRLKLVAVLLCAGVVSISSRASGGQEVSVRDLAQRGVDRVRDQLVVATQRGAGTTWATQPGAVSVFSTSGKPMSVYKLYSAPSMVESSVMRLGKDVPADWNEYPGRYVDLNAPRADGDGIQFPIADPRSDAEGFSYEPAIAGVVPGRFDAARLPMPVTWLYVLADGNEGYLDTKNRFVGPVAPTEENPIVGRYAFWADDNTLRINVNTASEGVYWDTPRVNTEEDRAYGRFQPAFGEYQRYPGHPARVSMSSVLYPDRRYRLPGTESGMGVLSLDETKAIWNAARGISDGGSLGGTQVIDTGIKTSIAPLPEDIVRYRDPMQVAANLPAGAAERVTKGKFFLTSDSRSSETNLLGYPRVGTWPTPNIVTNQTVFDKAIAAIGTVGRQPYYVQRQDAYSRHAEFYNNSAGRNAIVYEYLKAMTDATVPGFGSSFGSKYGAGRFDDRDQILAESLDYIRGANLFDGTNLGWKYTVGMNRDGAIGHGQTMAYCLCGGSSAHVARWYNPRLQPALGTGRMIGLSEVALMLVLRAETKMPDADGEVAYLGSRSDLEKFGLWDTGKDQAIPDRKLVQMGILVEGFAPAHGFTSLIPRNGIAIGSGVGNDFPDLPDSFTLDFASIKRGRPGNKEYPWATKTTAQRPKDWIAWGG